MSTRPLTEAHRLAQVRLGASVVAQVLQSWALIDPANVDARTAQWLEVNAALVAQAKRQSARMTANFYVELRRLSVPGRYVPRLVEEIDGDQLRTSLLVTGPYRLKRNTGQGVALDRALDVAKGSSAASAMRLALQGGRETLTENVKRDRQAIGYVRVTSGNACDFCAGLAGETFADADFEAHDGCSCSGEPQFS